MTIVSLLYHRNPIKLSPEEAQIAYFISWISILIFVFIIVDFGYTMVREKPLFVHLYLRRKKLSNVEKLIIAKHCNFYNKLSPSSKKNFEHRVSAFLKKYSFHGGDSFVVTPEHQLIIATAFVQLTFGLREYLIDSFERIVVYESIYYSNASDNWHKGEFNALLKTIVFSWEDVQKGFDTTSDAINLAYHEFSHAIHYCFFSAKFQSITIQIYVNYAQKIINYFKENNEILLKDSLFRSYAFENHFEFMAVLFEHFFENPIHLRQYHPELFGYIQKMINFNIRYL